MKGVRNTTPDSFFLDILLIQERLEDALIFYDEPIVLGEEPPQRDARQCRNRRHNVRLHHEAEEQDPAQPVSHDEAYEVGETLEERSALAATPAAMIVATPRNTSGEQVE